MPVFDGLKEGSKLKNSLYWITIRYFSFIAIASSFPLSLLMNEMGQDDRNLQ